MLMIPKVLHICDWCEDLVDTPSDTPIELTHVRSDFSYCDCCGRWQGNSEDWSRKITIHDHVVVEVIDEHHPEQQAYCRDGCAHLGCGNYSSITFKSVIRDVQMLDPE